MLNAESTDARPTAVIEAACCRPISCSRSSRLRRPAPRRSRGPRPGLRWPNARRPRIASAPCATPSRGARAMRAESSFARWPRRRRRATTGRRTRNERHSHGRGPSVVNNSSIRDCRMRARVCAMIGARLLCCWDSRRAPGRADPEVTEQAAKGRAARPATGDQPDPRSWVSLEGQRHCRINENGLDSLPLTPRRRRGRPRRAAVRQDVGQTRISTQR